MTKTPLLAGVELGGTKSIVVLGRGRHIVAQDQVPTRSPEETLPELGRLLTGLQKLHGPAEALGIGSFGPIRVAPNASDYGRMLRTPKPGWSGVDVLAPLSGLVDGPVKLDTDVNGAALAEGAWGASQGCRTHVYITIGTGIGAGLVAEGQPIHGTLHPEFGHIRVRRDPADQFGGVCPYHGDCLEGLASGPAIAARAGAKADTLGSGHPVWDRVAAELAEALAGLILTLAPERIVIGGGVGEGCAFLLPRIRLATGSLLAGYGPAGDETSFERLIVNPGLSAAGPVGSLGLAARALGQS